MKKEHKSGCPKLQAWDMGEWEAPCLCQGLDINQSRGKMKPTKIELQNALIILEKLANMVPASFNSREAIGLEGVPGPILKKELEAIRSLIEKVEEWKKKARNVMDFNHKDYANCSNLIKEIRDFGKEEK